jgi:hypothetical protein
MNRRPTPEIARERATAPVLCRLHALWCHRIVRARQEDWEFASLIAQGFAAMRLEGPLLRPGQADFVITSRGMNRAHDLFYC